MNTQTSSSNFFPFTSPEELYTNSILSTLTTQPELKHAWEVLPLLQEALATLTSYTDPTAHIAPSAILDVSSGPIVIATGARIGAFSIISGPCYIGVAAEVREFCLVANASIEQNSIIRPYSEVKHSLIMSETHVHACSISNSILGSNCRIAARTTLANRRLDRGEIACYLDQTKHPTGQSRLGAILGHRVHTGVGASLMPGVLVGSDTVIYPHKLITRNLHPHTHFK